MAPAEGGASAFASCQHRELAEAVEFSLSQLPTEQREVVVMKIWGGLTFGQIAKAIGVSPNTAASRYRYALQRLEAELAEEVDCD
ncbi:MAG TPA: sigma factor-like helix-turn-helix DNA-binding protein [Tepidisphaeraceae bacterium]|nr:sigma factor-like helix-turn-helix DNA-binding protein [Tepidisphaeraceae bacterium]